MGRRCLGATACAWLLASAALLGGCATTEEAPAPTSAEGRLSELEGDVTLAAILSPVDSADEALALGDEAASRGDLDEAILRYVRAAELRPDDPAIRYRIGAMHEDLGNLSLAVLGYRMALEVDAEYVPAHESLGLVLMRTRNLEQAKAHFERAIVRDKSRWRSHNGLGILADLDGEFGEARRHYEAALALQPSSAMVLTNLGYSYYLQGDLEQAGLLFERAIALEPRYSIAKRNLAIIQVRQGDYENALRLLEVNGNRAAAYNDLGYLCTIAGDYPAARRFLMKAIELSPTYYARAHENLAYLEMQMERGPGADGPVPVGDISRAAEQSTGQKRRTEPAAAPVQALQGASPAVTGTSPIAAQTTASVGRTPREAQRDSSETTPAWPAASAGLGATLEDRLEATEVWLAEQPDEYYTIQLMAASGEDEKRLENFLHEQRGRGLLAKTYVFLRPGNGPKRYYVLYDSFAGFGEASEAMETLPPALRAGGPYLRPIRHFRLPG